MNEKVIEKVRSSLLHRNVVGLLGMLLPFISMFSGLFVRNKVHHLLLFVFLSYNIGWLFTRGSNVKKNKIYKFCSYAMIVILSIFLLLKILEFCGLPIPGWIVMIAEALLLLFFGFAWLVKGQFVLKNL